MKKALYFSLLICSLCIPAKVYGGALGRVSDVLCVATPIIAVGSSLLLEDSANTGLFILQFMSQEQFVGGMKEVLSTSSIGQRPNGKGDKSKGFISSHTSSTTGGAIKLWRLYPNNYWVKGISTLAVGVVGYQRVHGGYHSEFQVGLGVATAFLFDYIGQVITERLQKSTPLTFQLSPTMESNGIEGMLAWRF